MEHRRSRREPRRDELAFRGALVAGAAVLVGTVILAGITSRPTAGVTPVATTTTTRPVATTTTTVAAPHTPANVTVLVLNGVDPKKAIAKPAAATVAAAGYTTPPGRDATTTVTKSIVYFVADYAPDAQAVAAILSIPPIAVVPLTPPAPPEVGDPAGAQVIVVIGPDAPAANG